MDGGCEGIPTLVTYIDTSGVIIVAFTATGGEMLET